MGGAKPFRSEKSELALLCLLCWLMGRPFTSGGASRLAAEAALRLETDLCGLSCASAWATRQPCRAKYSYVLVCPYSNT